MAARRNELLSAFLTRKRAEVSPETAGIEATGTRRVPGLRREEVAFLAGVSLDWYVRLEQGRPVTPSEQVLGAIARTLRLPWAMHRSGKGEKCGDELLRVHSHIIATFGISRRPWIPWTESGRSGWCGNSDSARGWPVGSGWSGAWRADTPLMIHRKM